ncbi:MAG TPA: acyltransferase [Steroidobacter sp.]|uniref:acyltransferase n=1 Tax=Steroidobacter sp. TaxID=1978227 RepID=UPI002EDB26E1
MSWLRIAFGTLLLTTNTLLHVPPLLLVALVKAIAPLRPVRRVCDGVLMAIAASWIGINTTLIRWFTRTRFVVDIDARLQPDGHYLVLANHQTWVDIPVLQAALNRRVPLLRFFLKSQLFWVPLLGLAWWALDFPFMKRYSRQQLEKRPELAGRDIAATRRACAKFMHIPVAVMNFVEGTRFTTAKHAQQSSPFAHLLKPKAGGVAFVLDAMGRALHSILDVTIVYPDGRPTMLDLFANRLREVRVTIRERPIPAELLEGDYQNDPAFRERVQAWLNDLWGEKDRLITQQRAV